MHGNSAQAERQNPVLGVNSWNCPRCPGGKELRKLALYRIECYVVIENIFLQVFKYYENMLST